jgi:hypothetical protein
MTLTRHPPQGRAMDDAQAQRLAQALEPSLRTNPRADASDAS